MVPRPSKAKSYLTPKVQLRLPTSHQAEPQQPSKHGWRKPTSLKCWVHLGYFCMVPRAFNGGMLNSIQTYLFTQNNQKTLFMDQKRCWRWSSKAKEGPCPHTGTSLSRKMYTRQEARPLGVISHNFNAGKYTAHSKGHLYVHFNAIRQRLGRWDCEG